MLDAIMASLDCLKYENANRGCLGVELTVTSKEITCSLFHYDLQNFNNPPDTLCFLWLIFLYQVYREEIVIRTHPLFEVASFSYCYARHVLDHILN